MGKRNYGSEYGFATRSVHTGSDIDAGTGAIRRPIELGATISPFNAWLIMRGSVTLPLMTS